MRLLFSVALLLAPASALLRQPALLRTAPAAAPLRAAAPQMILGSKTFRKAVLSVRRSSTIKGCSPGDGSVGGGSGVGGGNGAQMSAGGDDDESNPFASAWKKYNELLDEKPLLMKAFTSFLGFAIGDILAQIFIQKQDFDWCARERAGVWTVHPSLCAPERAAGVDAFGGPAHVQVLLSKTSMSPGTGSSASPASASSCTAPRRTGKPAPPSTPPTDVLPGRPTLPRRLFGRFYGMLDSAIPGKGAQPVFTKVFIDQARAPPSSRRSPPSPRRAAPLPRRPPSTR